MILNRDDTIFAYDFFMDYYRNYFRIDDFLRAEKIKLFESKPMTLPGFGVENDIFSDFSISPQDMDFKLILPKQSVFHDFLEHISSHTNSKSIPGKSLHIMVKENNTNKIVGLITLGSPTINSKPRNIFLGKPLDTMNPDVMKRFNDSTIMGFVIVPVQPFGFNYLGGKLLAGLCCSHEITQLWEEKYGGNICLFETTSLYGSTKTASQYDGMKPFLRYGGLTDSNFIPPINSNAFRHINNWFKQRNNGEPLIDPGASSKKLKTMTKMISIIKKSLQNHDMQRYKDFCALIEKLTNMTEQKRTYMSTYGYDNVKDYLNLETDNLVKRDNYDRFCTVEVVDWWKNKAQKRYESLQLDGRLRSELELWNQNTDIDIIR